MNKMNSRTDCNVPVSKRNSLKQVHHAKKERRNGVLFLHRPS